MTNFKDTVQITFEIIVILASLGVVGALFKNLYTKFKKALLYFHNIESRLENVEKKIYKPKRKTKTK